MSSGPVTIIGRVVDKLRVPRDLYRFDIDGIPDAATHAQPWCVIPDDRVVTYAGVPLPTPLPRPLGSRVHLGVESTYTGGCTLVEACVLVFYDAAGGVVGVAPIGREVWKRDRWMLGVAVEDQEQP